MPHSTEQGPLPQRISPLHELEDSQAMVQELAKEQLISFMHDSLPQRTLHGPTPHWMSPVQEAELAQAMSQAVALVQSIRPVHEPLPQSITQGIPGGQVHPALHSMWQAPSTQVHPLGQTGTSASTWPWSAGSGPSGTGPYGHPTASCLSGDPPFTGDR